MIGGRGYDPSALFAAPLEATARGPRDGLGFDSTTDLPFLIALHLTCVGRGATGVIVAAPENEPARWYAYESGEQWIAPLSGEDVPLEPGVVFSVHDAGALPERIRSGLWMIRTELATAPSATIDVDMLSLTDNGRRRRGALARLNRRLTRPVVRENDPLVHGELAALEWRGLVGAPVPAENESLCPLDGIVETVPAVYSTNIWAWKHRCGRRYQLMVCPKCLAELGVGETMMS